MKYRTNRCQSPRLWVVMFLPLLLALVAADVHAATRILWITNHGDPRSGEDWKITEGPDLPVFREFFDSIERAEATIQFGTLSKHRSSLRREFDILIVRTRHQAEFAAAREFLRNGGGVLVLADYFYSTGNEYYADIATRQLTGDFGIRITQGGGTGKISLTPASHPVADGLGTLYVENSRGAHTVCTGVAAPVLGQRGESKSWAAAWDGSPADQGRLLVIPDTGFWWGSHVRARAPDHFIFWTRAFRWLAGSTDASLSAPMCKQCVKVCPTDYRFCPYCGKPRATPPGKGAHSARQQREANTPQPEAARTGSPAGNDGTAYGSPEIITTNFLPTPFEITSFHHNGNLTFAGPEIGATCTVQWASSPDGPWFSDWSTLSEIVVTSATTAVVVPMFYRVASNASNHR